MHIRKPIVALLGALILFALGAASVARADESQAVDVPANFVMQPPDGLQCVCFGADDKVLFTGGYPGPDGVLVAWSLETGKQISSRKLDKDGSGIYAMALSPDQKLIAAVGQFDDIKLLDATTGAEVQSLKPLVAKGIAFAAVAWSPDGTRLAWVGDGGTVIWDVSAGKPIQVLKGVSPSTVAISPDNSLLLTATCGNRDPNVSLYDIATGQLLHKIGTKVTLPSWGLFLDDKKFAAQTSINDFATFDVKSGGMDKRQTTNGASGFAALSPNHQLILISGAVTDDPGPLALRNLSTGDVLATFKGHTQIPQAVVYSLDGKWVATISQDNTARATELPADLAKLGAAPAKPGQ